MRVFVDANVLVNIVQRKYPEYEVCARLLSLQGSLRFQLYTSPLCLAIAFYFAEKKSGTSEALKKIRLLAQNLNITICGPEETQKAAKLKSAPDFEDALEYESALSSSCEVLVTYDTDDFFYAAIPVVKPMAFFEQFVFPS
jgi:predicted nucleic acid-binding protein